MGAGHVDDGSPAARTARHGRATLGRATALPQGERAADPSPRLSADEPECLQACAHQAELEQRQALAAELHETVLQTLFSLQLAAQTALESCESEPARARTALELLLRLLCEARTDVHIALFELRENVLTSDGLARALEHLVDLIGRQGDLRIRLQLQGHARLPAAYQESLYRVAREGITNVVKHARARHASVILTVDEGGVRLGVEDDGIGFAEVDPECGSCGLRLLRERVQALGGTLRLGNRPEGGAYLQVTLPPPEGT